MKSHIVVGLLQFFKLIDHNRDISLVDLNEVGVVEQALDRQELSLFLFLHHADILAEFDQLFVKLVLSVLFLLLTKDQIDLIGDTHALVLFLIVFPVGDRIGWLSRDQSRNLTLLFIKRFLFGD